MKTRTIVGAAAIPLFLLLIFFAPLWAYAIVVGLICAGCSWEFLRCVAPDMKRRYKLYAFADALALPIVYVFVPSGYVVAASLYFLVAAMFLELMVSFKYETRVKLETILQVVFAGSIMPMLLLSLVRIGLREHHAVYVLLPLLAAAACDTGAYFVGSFLGKRKIFPHLSPNKTWEGCVGGLVCDVALMLLYALLVSVIGKREVDYLSFAVYGLLGGVACEFGDLAFSSIKREFSIKDYGKLIPGHGGMLDRFDSMHFTAPMIELLVLLLPAIKS